MRWRTIPFASILACAALLSLRAAEAAAITLNPRSTGSPFVRTWNDEDYAAAPVNYAVLPHSRNGFIYAGNNYGVLEFDGAAWRLYPLPGEGPARTLAIDATAPP